MWEVRSKEQARSVYLPSSTFDEDQRVTIRVRGAENDTGLPYYSRSISNISLSTSNTGAFAVLMLLFSVDSESGVRDHGEPR